ncbi:MAG: HAMP domain-containing histidine kinase [Myxococcales bacterium]|nr:HAMP domain-containing histidine kinase [Myxococcales bacterium]USN50475.1 MAG: HAMP domain-containing histidine kinase [Myxococcales bacterium]
MCLSFFLLATLVNWQMYLSLLAGGLITAFILSGLFVGNFYFTLSALCQLLYVVAFSLIIGMVFSRKRDNDTQEKIASLRILSATIAHELRTPLTTISLACKTFDSHMPSLVDTYERYPAKEKIPIAPQILNYLSSAPSGLYKMSRSNLLFIDMMLKRFRGVKGLDKLEKCHIKENLDFAFENFVFENNERTLIDSSQVSDFLFYGDSNLFVHVIFNLLNNSLSQFRIKKQGCIILSSHCSETKNQLHFCDYTGGIPKDIFPSLFLPLTTYGKKHGTGIGLSFCKEVMQRFQGEISCSSDHKTYTNFILSFPKIDQP